MPTLAPMSPAQAAQMAKVSRRTIMRAIETHELLALRDNKNRWQITSDALETWAGSHRAPSEHAHLETPTLPTNEAPEITAQLAAAETRAEMLAEQLKDAKEDRDKWRAMAEKLAERPRRWWPWSRS